MKPSRQITQRAWLWSALAVTAMWVFLFACCDVRFAINDDQYMLRSFAGVSPGGAPTFHYYVHTIYCYLFLWLSRLMPGVAWLSILEIVLMWLSTVTLCKSIYQCFAQRNRVHLGVFLTGCFLLLFPFYLSARFTYTTVAACAGTASVAQILSVDCETSTDGQIVRSMLYALLLLVLGYMLRSTAAFAALPFCGVAFLLRVFTCFGFGKSRKRSLRPMIIALVLVAVVMGGLVVAREIEIDVRGQRENVEWHNARVSVVDFANSSAIPEEGLMQLGWQLSQAKLLRRCYTMDACYTTENFQEIRQEYVSSMLTTPPNKAVSNFITHWPLQTFQFVLLLVFGIGCVVSLALQKQTKWTFWALLCTLGGCLVMLAYLGLIGRLIDRSAIPVILPAAVLVFCLSVDCMPPKRRLTAWLCALLAVGTVLVVSEVLHRVCFSPKRDDRHSFAADDIAAQNPDLLFIHEQDLVNDLRIFPDFSDGLPVNLMFWGGWQRGLSNYRSKLEAFDIDPDNFTAEDWINPDVRFLTLAEEPNEWLVTHLREELGEDLTWEQELMDGDIYAYRFYVDE